MSCILQQFSKMFDSDTTATWPVAGSIALESIGFILSTYLTIMRRILVS